MSTHAASLLDDAWRTFMKVASTDDPTGISNQSPSWYPITVNNISYSPKGQSTFINHRSTPYDFAAGLCKSLLPFAYNYPPSDQEATEWLWEQFIITGEVIDIKYLNEYYTERAYNA